MHLVKPALDYLPSYRAALERGWSPDNVRLADATREQLAAIEADPAAFVASLDDPEAKGPPIPLLDGRLVPRLPGFRRWMWDGGFAGSIGLRWQKGTSALPPHVLGHIGYAVVPWKRKQGFATEALRLMLHEARVIGLDHVDITADPDNVASHKVVLANGGVEMERFFKDPGYGGQESVRFRILLKGVVTVRNARPDERAFLEDLQWRSSLTNPSYSEALSYRRDVVRLEPEHIPGTAVAERDGEVAGFAVLTRDAEGAVELDGLFVEPALQRQGIGKRLMAEAKRRAMALGATALKVVAAPDAEAFYRDSGFVLIAETDTLFGKALVMSAPLPA